MKSTKSYIAKPVFCGFFCVRLTQPRSLGTGYSNSNLVGVRKFVMSAPVSSLHLAQYTYTTCAHIYLVGMGARHTGGIELRHCDVSPSEVVWERIPEGPLRY